MQAVPPPLPTPLLAVRGPGALPAPAEKPKGQRAKGPKLPALRVHQPAAAGETCAAHCQQAPAAAVQHGQWSPQ